LILSTFIAYSFSIFGGWLSDISLSGEVVAVFLWTRVVIFRFFPLTVAFLLLQGCVGSGRWPGSSGQLDLVDWAIVG
jgi:hypothetical protein